MKPLTLTFEDSRLPLKAYSDRRIMKQSAPGSSRFGERQVHMSDLVPFRMHRQQFLRTGVYQSANSHPIKSRQFMRETGTIADSAAYP
jgi:hypothetical protein